MAIDLSASRLLRGAAAGLVAAIAMGLYAMIASLVKDTGFLTPLYHIASSIGSPDAMMASMEAAASGDSLYLAGGPLVLGAVIHMMVGAVAGLVFAVLIGIRAVSRLVAVIAGVVYGLLVMAVNSLITLPLTARIFDSGDPIAEMGSMAGWTTFTVEHMIFGLVLGLLVGLRRDTGSEIGHTGRDKHRSRTGRA